MNSGHLSSCVAEAVRALPALASLLGDRATQCVCITAEYLASLTELQNTITVGSNPTRLKARGSLFHWR